MSATTRKQECTDLLQILDNPNFSFWTIEESLRMTRFATLGYVTKGHGPLGPTFTFKEDGLIRAYELCAEFYPARIRKGAWANVILDAVHFCILADEPVVHFPPRTPYLLGLLGAQLKGYLTVKYAGAYEWWVEVTEAGHEFIKTADYGQA